MCLETHQKEVCRGLVDGNAKAIKAGWGLACVFSRRIRKWFVWAGWMGTQRRSRRDGGLACTSRRIRNLSLDLLDVKARAITANKMGALAYIARSMVALLHIVPGAYMGSSFSLC